MFLIHFCGTCSDIVFISISLRINVEESLGDGQAKVGLLISSLGHAALVFVNKKPVGFGYGNHDDASFVLTGKLHLNHGENTLDILSMMVGLQVCNTFQRKFLFFHGANTLIS